MKTLLIPTDFTVQSDTALIYAQEMADKMKAKVTLFHAYHSFPTDETLPYYLNSSSPAVMKKASEEQLKKRCSEIEENSSCQCDYINLEGMAQRSIVNETKKLKPELLIMGREKYNPIQRLAKSKTERVIQEVDCNVLAVPLLKDFVPIKKIAFAVDYHTSEIREIEYLLELAKSFDAEIHIVHVIRGIDNITIEKNYFETFKDEVITSFPKSEFIFSFIEGDKVSESLENYVNEEQISIMAVSKTKKDIMESTNSKGVSIQLFKELEIPLLLINVG